MGKKESTWIILMKEQKYNTSSASSRIEKKRYTTFHRLYEK